MPDSFKALCPIFLKRIGHDKVEQVGSGVSVQIATDIFLLTAAHVTDFRKDGLLLIPGKDGLTRIIGHFCHLAVPRGLKRLDDKEDISYFHLASDLAENLHKSIIPLRRENLFITDNLLEGDIYSFAGYPWRKSKLINGQAITELFIFTGGAAPERKYKLLGYDNHLHLLIKFARKKCFMRGKKVTALLPHGISGGGVFRWPKDIMKRPRQGELSLVAIAHSYYEKQNCLAGTNLKIYLACIFRNNPHLIERAEQKRSYHPLPLLAGLVWYRQEEWSRLLSEFDDAGNMHDTWDEWRESTENCIEQMARSGGIIFPVELSADEIGAFCKRRGIKNDGRARADLANIRIAEWIFEKEIETV